MINQIDRTTMPFHIVRRMFDPTRMIEKSNLTPDWGFNNDQEDLIRNSIFWKIYDQ